MLWKKASGENTYISVFPSSIIKYNKVDTNLIEFISTNVKDGEDVFKYVDDSDSTIDCEDILIRNCDRVEHACVSRRFSALLSSRFTEIVNKTATVMSFYEFSRITLRFKEIYLLKRTAEVCREYEILKNSKLSSLNLIFNFLR